MFGGFSYSHRHQKIGDVQQNARKAYQSGPLPTILFSTFMKKVPLRHVASV
jgi:hypothetical protein